MTGFKKNLIAIFENQIRSWGDEVMNFQLEKYWKQALIIIISQ